MTDALFAVSYTALWGLTVILAVLLLGTLRTLGTIRLRLGPEVPLDHTDLVPGAHLAAPWLPEAAESGLVVLFVAPACGVCERVLEGMRGVLDGRPRDAFVIVAQADHEESRAYLTRFGLDGLMVVADPGAVLSEAAGVHDTPYAVLLDRDRRIKRAAIVNNGRQVESLLEASPVGVGP